MILTIDRNLSPVVMGGIVLAAIATFFVLVLATKVITGEEKIIYYHHEIAVMVTATLLLWCWRQPVLPFLDITILGVGLFLACGRVGCFLVGCCHGRPHRWGVRYRKQHAEAGFTGYFVGVRLFPIQLTESLWVLFIVGVGVVAVLRGGPPGTALAWYVVTYDLGRFCFEFMRGDPDRPYLWGFSQPQWISVVLMIVVVWLEQSGFLPLTGWHLLAAAVLVAAMLVTATKRRFRRVPKHRLLHPRHVREIAGLLGALADVSSEASHPCRWTVIPGQYSGPDVVRIGDTSIGLRISAGKILDHSAAPVHHYALSCRGAEMPEETARLLATVICQLRHHSGHSRLIKGDRGVFHALFAGEC